VIARMLMLFWAKWTPSVATALLDAIKATVTH
jgi:hypothetical protein